MKTTSRWLVLVALACGLGQAEPLTIVRLRGSNDDFSILFESRLEPSGTPSQARGFGGGVKVSDNLFHRFLRDRTQKKYFGYDIEVDAVNGEKAYLVSILPLSLGPERMRFEDPDSWSALSLPRYPPPQKVGWGDRIAFDLLINPETGQRIVEYLSIGDDPQRRIAARGPARDFTVEDAELSLSRPRFAVNGKPLEATAKWSQSVTGRVGWIYLRPQGRFLFSLLPRGELGFRRAGEIRGSTLTFDWGADSYQLNCWGRIAPGSGAYHLYVFHDPVYRPRGRDAEAEFLMGAADRAESLLP